MKKIMSTIAMACLSFSCFAESYFVKVNANEYVMQHGEKSEKLKYKKPENFSETRLIDAIYTPTHVFAYPDGTPSLLRNIQKIEYTKSNVTFYKDIKTRKCCIDILDDKENANKCRIIGVNGHEIINIKDPNIGSFEVYEVAGEANSFTDSTSRLIFVDHSGLYIVEKDKNAVEDISKNYFLNRKFDFKGEIIKISAVDGKREAIGFGKDQKEIFAFNCPSDAPVSFEVEATPVMKQIEEITGVKLITPPPSEEAALQRMADILDILPVELLVIDDGQVKLANKVQIISSTAQFNPSLGMKPLSTATPKFSFSSGSSTTSSNSLSDILKNIGNDVWIDNPLIDKLKGIIGVSSKKSVITKGMLEKVRDYKFDTSPEAKKRRKEIALKPWDK